MGLGSTLTALLFLALVAVAVDGGSDPNVLLVSFDGMRWDYLDHYASALPTFRRLTEGDGGVRLTLRPSFTTKTFPNHVTLVTGVYEEVHGEIIFFPSSISSRTLLRWGRECELEARVSI